MNRLTKVLGPMGGLALGCARCRLVFPEHASWCPAHETNARRESFLRTIDMAEKPPQVPGLRPGWSWVSATHVRRQGAFALKRGYSWWGYLDPDGCVWLADSLEQVMRLMDGICSSYDIYNNLRIAYGVEVAQAAMQKPLPKNWHWHGDLPYLVRDNGISCRWFPGGWEIDANPVYRAGRDLHRLLASYERDVR